MYSRVYVEITNICNKSCSFCHGTRRPPHRMSFGEFARVTDSLCGVTEYLYLHVLGEPLTHPMLPFFCEHAAKRGFKVALTTNGTLLEQKVPELIAAGLYKINISLHSFEAGERSEQRRYIESCLDSAEALSGGGVLTVLRLWNKQEDGGFVSPDADLGNEMLWESIKRRYGEPDFVSGRGARLHHRLHLEYGERFDWPDIEGESLGERVFCHGLGDHFGILSDGSMVPCCLDADGIITLGNIFKQDINSILSSPRSLAIAEGFKKKQACEPLCQKCGYARRFKL